MPLPQANLLAEETSPYLRQHKDNPVHWRPWSRASLAEAAELDRPILLSVGYAACHWCHVMAHESFEDPDVAALMNRLYVNIKVDREERPDIDQIYMAALSATGEQGGWPLTMFLTPGAKPFWGGTYFPKNPRFGRPGFIQVLGAVHRAWQDRRDELANTGNVLNDHVAARLSALDPAADETARSFLPQLSGSIHSMIDHRLGGLRGAPKFPHAPFMVTLWLSWLESGNTDHRDAVILSLRNMLDGGIYDHVGGGLCRYSTDAEWLVPHFEKMLYDNAQLIRIANWAWAETGDETFRDRIETTVEWLLREMRVEGGGFAASLDADSGGEEGAFYTWDRSEIESVLGPDSETFFSAYTLSGPANWEGRPILHRSSSPDGAASGEGLRPLLGRLLDHRETRVRPGRDDKVLVDWNSLLIEALAQAARGLDRPEWLEAAKSAYRFVRESKDADGRLPHSILGDRKLFPAMSSDYASMAGAAIALYEATGEATYVNDASAFLELTDRWYIDEAHEGHYLTASDATDVPIRIRGDVDEAIPSATGQIIEAFARVGTATNRIDLLDRAWTIAKAASGRLRSQAYGQSGIVNACTMLESARKLVIVEDQAGPTLSKAARAHPDPRRADLVLPLGGEPVELPGGVKLDTSRAAAWLCIGQACLPPIDDAAELEKALRPTGA
ncbi:thioredoxin domain-containing protein [Mesorhizobium sp. BAC0120]|uniref:thioredoxin domain-containing protein n=1 Tax=Mesorhizobium sp. BAC0120 TaxID=3090670 RepID=UPI00298C87FB|nr:thioredoxin domain-containing protein [Mesorhizobium sp. BAC0120]MDW6024484.1 thioredoxin domain-containing protein [Mesorhizobium sp. BAC0120]